MKDSCLCLDVYNGTIERAASFYYEGEFRIDESPWDCMEREIPEIYANLMEYEEEHPESGFDCLMNVVAGGYDMEANTWDDILEFLELTE